MSKEKVFIVLSHKHSLKAGSKTDWEVAETVEFVNQLRDRHISYSSAIGDYLNEKMISGKRYGMDQYSKFEEYIRKKYSKQLSQLDSMYKAEKNVAVDNSPELVMGADGSLRPKTVMDV